jgi:hypothetical protein
MQTRRHMSSGIVQGQESATRSAVLKTNLCVKLVYESRRPLDLEMSLFIFQYLLLPCRTA